MDHPSSILDCVTLFGVVKEGVTADGAAATVEGLSEFALDAFASRPLYGDANYAFYQALGDRKVPLSHLLTPSALIGIVCDTYRRSITKRKTSALSRATSDGSTSSHTSTGSNSGPTIMGEGITQGGIIIFGANGKPAAMYPEETGTDLRLVDIASALAAIRKEQEKATSAR
jgi:hypothetical protein